MSKTFQADAAVAVRPCEQLLWQRMPLQHRTGSFIFEALFQPQQSQDERVGIATLLESPYPLPPDSLPEAAAEMARFSICAGSPRVVDGRSQLWTPRIGQVLGLFRHMGRHVVRHAAEEQSAQPSTCAHQHQRDSAQKNSAQRNSARRNSAQTNRDISELPFTGGWLGWLGYDCAWEIEQLPWLKEDALPFPAAFWYEPAEFAVLDHYKQQLWLAADTSSGLLRMTKCLQARSADGCSGAAHGDRSQANALSSDRTPSASASAEAVRRDKTQSLRFKTSQSEFEQAVVRAKEHIRAGDVFQVNHSLRFQTKTALPSWAVYKALHAINPSPFASYWQTPWGSVVSCSPERLVHLRNRRAQSRPIAGTRPRGKTAAEDDAIATDLKDDCKENAEHIMLVDLERNDLGRVCKWGSVAVAELMTIERYSHVMHLVSNVVGELDAGISDEAAAANLVAALFPGGTITGCPKVRCMEIIESLEPVRRSLFYGSCGYFDRRGQLDLNILIRTLLMAPIEGTAENRVWGQVGAGIVADSQPEKEWHESLQKAQAQLIALGLAE